MIIVTPDAGLSWYINSYDGKVKYEDFFVQELIPYIEKNYRALKEKRFRAIAGLSMGGYGSFVLALKHPDLFAACCPLSAGVLVDDEVVKMDPNGWSYIFGGPFGKTLQGKDRLTEHYYGYSIQKLIENGNADAMKQVRYYIDCGDDDFLIKGNMDIHSELLDKQIPHEFRVRDGGHTWTYWRTALPEVLKFVSQSFHQ
jgi:S-formylglutathione hydrolase FrmB